MSARAAVDTDRSYLRRGVLHYPLRVFHRISRVSTRPTETPLRGPRRRRIEKGTHHDRLRHRAHRARAHPAQLGPGLRLRPSAGGGGGDPVGGGRDSRRPRLSRPRRRRPQALLLAAAATGASGAVTPQQSNGKKDVMAWVWMVVAGMALIALVVLLVALVVGRRARTRRLKQRFGP